MEQYQIDVNDSRVYPMGLTRIDGGIHVTTVAAAKACSLLLFAKEEKSGKGVKFHEVFHMGTVIGYTCHVVAIYLVVCAL